jgi:hypothetical protein
MVDQRAVADRLDSSSAYRADRGKNTRIDTEERHDYGPDDHERAQRRDKDGRSGERGEPSRQPLLPTTLTGYHQHETSL